MSTFANIEDPDEMQHHASGPIHWVIKNSDKRVQYILKLQPDILRYVQWTFPSYCIKPEGRIH